MGIICKKSIGINLSGVANVILGNKNVPISLYFRIHTQRTYTHTYMHTHVHANTHARTHVRMQIFVIKSIIGQCLLYKHKVLHIIHYNLCICMCACVCMCICACARWAWNTRKWVHIYCTLSLLNFSNNWSNSISSYAIFISTRWTSMNITTQGSRGNT